MAQPTTGPIPPEAEMPTRYKQVFESNVEYERVRMREKLENWFTYHSPTPFQTQKYNAINAACKYLAEVIVDNTPPGADQSDAIRKLREVRMTANAAIACNGE